MRNKTRYCIVTIILILIAPVLHATPTLSSSIIGMFPKNVSEFGYADLKNARQFGWFPQFENQVVPVSLYNFDQFLNAAQTSQTSTIDQVAWARVSHQSEDGSNPKNKGDGQLVEVAVGHFDLDAIKTFLSSRKTSSVQVGNDVVYPSESGSGVTNIYFALLDGETIAFGPLESLTRILEIRHGDEESLVTNESMMNLINQANGEGMFWGVFGSTGAGPALQQLVPEASKFPQASALFGKIGGMLVMLKSSDDFELDFQGTTSSPNDAALLSQLLQAGILYRQYEVTQSNPDLAKILGAISIASNGSNLELSARLTDDQVLNLVEHNIFSPSI